MKNKLAGILAASIFTLPAWAGSDGHSGGGHSNGGGNGGSTPTSSSTANANGGAGGNGGSATGGAATGGSATGGLANGNTSTVNVSLTSSTGGSGSAADGLAGEVGSSAYNSKATVEYGGTYTVKSAPPIAAPSLTSTFSDTCMGSSSFGLSVVGFGATGGTTMVDDACVRRLDSREFRAMGLNDVALALLCQSVANRKAVEATGRSCPSASPPTASAANTSQQSEQYTDPFVRRRLGMEPIETAPTPMQAQVTVAAVQRGEPDLKQLPDAAADK